jgi:putative heme iron utilization protein
MSKATDTSEAVMTGIDRYGFEISANTNLGQRPIRLAFDNEVSTPDEARKELVMMVKRQENFQNKVFLLFNVENSH